LLPVFGVSLTVVPSSGATIGVVVSSIGLDLIQF